MHRSSEAEILDGDVPAEVAERAYRDLCLTHRLLGNTAAIVQAIKRDPLPVRRVLDVGCGHGGILAEIQRRLGVEVIGVDLKPPARAAAPFEILQADATRDVLPEADIAISLCMAHHLSEDDFAAMVTNVGRSCRRFVILDLVRHRLPLILFRIFAPLVVSPINVVDGCRSIRRAYTPREFRTTIEHALEGTRAKLQHSVAPFFIRQIADITYRNGMG